MCRPIGSRLSRVALLLVQSLSTSSSTAVVSDAFFSLLGYAIFRASVPGSFTGKDLFQKNDESYLSLTMLSRWIELLTEMQTDSADSQEDNVCQMTDS